MPLGINIGQMRLVIKIRITWANKNILGYLLKYKFPLLPLAEQSRIQPYTGDVLLAYPKRDLFVLGLVCPSETLHVMLCGF